MKLQKQVSRTFKTKKFGKQEYLKYWIVIPTKIIEKLKWNNKEDINSKEIKNLLNYLEEEECKQKEE